MVASEADLLPFYTWVSLDFSLVSFFFPLYIHPEIQHPKKDIIGRARPLTRRVSPGVVLIKLSETVSEATRHPKPDNEVVKKHIL